MSSQAVCRCKLAHRACFGNFLPTLIPRGPVCRDALPQLHFNATVLAPVALGHETLPTPTLQQVPGITEFVEAATREETLEKLEACRPDVVIMNTTLVDAYSIEVLQQIKRLQPSVPVILLHPEPDAVYAALALANGASGIITKLGSAGELIEAVEITVGGGIYVGADIKALMNGTNQT